jgi:DNA-binding LacI/PurR family transcriptional regulator
MPLKKNAAPSERKVTLKTIAQHLGLSVGTISAILNGSDAALSIPDHTKQRVLDAARELNYRPNYFARALRLQRTYTIGVITEQIGDPYGAMIINGIEEYLRGTEYFFLTVIHRHDRQVLQNYSSMLKSRGVEGFITIDTSIMEASSLPTVAIANHTQIPGVTNLVLDERLAARLVLEHLLGLGHRDIAFLKGDATSADSATRWEAICDAAQELGVQMRPELTAQLHRDVDMPEYGYQHAKELLARSQPFTALVAYNDISAVGAMWALREAGLRVPDDVSVVGFDDVPLAAMSTHELTTIRQPLHRMGQVAVMTVIEQIERPPASLSEIVIEPELVIRSSTGPVRKMQLDSNRRLLGV